MQERDREEKAFIKRSLYLLKKIFFIWVYISFQLFLRSDSNKIISNM